MWRVWICVLVCENEHLVRQWHEMYCHDLEVMSSNPGRVELGVRSTSVLSRTWSKIICVCVCVCVCARVPACLPACMPACMCACVCACVFSNVDWCRLFVFFGCFRNTYAQALRLLIALTDTSQPFRVALGKAGYLEICVDELKTIKTKQGDEVI